MDIPELRPACGKGCWKRGLTPWQLLPVIYGPFRTQQTLAAPTQLQLPHAAALLVLKAF